MKTLDKMTPHEIAREILRQHHKQINNFIDFTTQENLSKKIEIDKQIDKTNNDFYNALEKLIELASK